MSRHFYKQHAYEVLLRAITHQGNTNQIHKEAPLHTARDGQLRRPDNSRYSRGAWRLRPPAHDGETTEPQKLLCKIAWWFLNSKQGVVIPLLDRYTQKKRKPLSTHWHVTFHCGFLQKKVCMEPAQMSIHRVPRGWRGVCNGRLCSSKNENICPSCLRVSLIPGLRGGDPYSWAKRRKPVGKRGF